jgi:hypothetical protein
MFKPSIEKLPGYHETLRQSIDNPAQPERMPEQPSLALELRTRLNSPPERRAIRGYIAWQLAWRFALLAIGKFLSGRHYAVGNLYFAILILLGLISCARGLLANRSAPVRWFAYVVVCPLLAAPAFLFDRPYYDLALGVLALSLFADRLATHHFFSRTAAVKPQRRKWLRLAWRNRFNLMDSASRRIALYALAVAVPLLFYAFVLYRREKPVEYLYLDDLFLLAPAVGIAFVVALLLEPTINLLYRQPVKHPLRVLLLAWQALRDWSSYNIYNRALPGVFVSPAGPIHTRLQLLFGAILLTAVPFTELTLYKRLLYPAREETAIEGASQQAKPVHLEPYQQALVAQMNEDERARFLAKLAADANAPKEVRVHLWFDNDRQMTEQEKNEFDIRVSYLMLLVMSAPVSAHILALLPPLILVPAVILLCLSPAVARAESEAEEAGAREGRDPPFDAASWESFVSLLQQSPNPVERASFFLGLNAADDSPVVVPRRVFEEHAHFLGDSGSGKTTLGLAPLISQMIRGQDCSVVIIDLKGDDPALFENARIEAQKAGLRFRWFTNELGKATYVFNPLLQRHLAELSLYQRTDLLTASLGLQYGTDYGRGFFSDANAELLYHALRAKPHLGSFVELSQILKQREPFRTVSSQLKMAGSHLAAIVTRLGSTEALNARPGDGASPELLRAAIDMRQPFEERQVIYFHLSSALGTATSAEIARMAMFSLLSASKFVEGQRRQVFLIVDEFQRAVSNNLELFLQTARSMNIGVILANQSLSDLKKPGVDIVSTVRTNTRYRQLFAVGEMHDLQEVIFTSGETLVHGRSWNQTFGASLFGPAGVLRSRTFTEAVTPRLRVNDLLLASDHPLQSVCHVRRGDGFAQYGGMPFIIKSTYHISPEEYVKRKQASWPEETAETFTPTLATTDPIAAEAAPARDALPDTQASTAAAKRLFAGLDKHFQEQKASRRKSAQDDAPSLD